MTTKKIWLEARGGAAEAVEIWRREYLAARNAWMDYAISIGAIKFYCVDRPPMSFGFDPDKVPAGWRKQSDRDGGIWVLRKRGRSLAESQAIEKAARELDALPRIRNFDMLMREFGLPDHYSYASATVRGGSGLGFPRVWQATWTGETSRILILGPDVPAICDEIRQQGYEVTVNAGDGTIPGCFTVMSREEADFIQAGERLEARRRHEEAAAAAATNSI